MLSYLLEHAGGTSQALPDRSGVVVFGAGSPAAIVWMHGGGAA